MKNFLKVVVFLLSNVAIGITTIVAIIGLFVGGLYIFELAEKFFIQITPLSVQVVLSVSVTSIIALYLLAIFGTWVREKIEDIFWEIRSKRQVAK